MLLRVARFDRVEQALQLARADLSNDERRFSEATNDLFREQNAAVTVHFGDDHHEICALDLARECFSAPTADVTGVQLEIVSVGRRKRGKLRFIAIQTTNQEHSHRDLRYKRTMSNITDVEAATSGLPTFSALFFRH
jgi:hypothetical protein